MIINFRSQIQQQRIIALNCLAGILENYMVGNYWFLDLPLAKIFFVIRFALDDNAASALHPALRAMSAFFFHYIDEVILNALVLNYVYIIYILFNYRLV